MATRTSFRPRPVDINKQLLIVRELTELDTTDGLFPKEESQPAIDGGIQAPPPAEAAPSSQGLSAGGAPHVKKPKPKEIPVPENKIIPTYTRDYLPTFRIPDTYIRGRGGTGYAVEDHVEYDLDNDDEDWLEALNRGDPGRLPDTKFERMLWRLELAWSEALEASTGPTDRASTTALGSTACLPKVQALYVLRKTVGGRDLILEQVYEYWLGKRKRFGKPILKRLQAPTNPTDPNPYNVFRPREKANRPLTRRRRENSSECMEKLRQIRENILRAMELAELLLLRERKKSDLHHVDMTMQRCQLNLQHQPPSMHAGVEQQATLKLRELMARSSLADQRITAYSEVLNGMPFANLDATMQRLLMRKRRRLDSETLAYMAVTNSEALSKLPPPIPPPEIEPLWAYQPNLLTIIQQQQQAGKPIAASFTPELVAALQAGTAQAYVGRGGRIVLARCDPLTLEQFTHSAEGVLDGVLRQDGVTGLQGGAAGDGTPAGAAVTVGGASATDVADANLFAFQPPALSPWALAFDLALLPEYVDKGPYIAAQQRWLKQQELLGRAVGTARVGSGVGGGGGFSLSPSAATRGTSGAGAATAAAARQRMQQAVASQALAPHRSPSPSLNLGGARPAISNLGAANGVGAGLAGHKLLPQARATTGPSFQLNRGPGRPNARPSQGQGSDLSLPLLDTPGP